MVRRLSRCCSRADTSLGFLFSLGASFFTSYRERCFLKVPLCTTSQATHINIIVILTSYHSLKYHNRLIQIAVNRSPDPTPKKDRDCMNHLPPSTTRRRLNRGMKILHTSDVFATSPIIRNGQEVSLSVSSTPLVENGSDKRL